MNFKTYFINKNNKTLKFCTVVKEAILLSIIVSFALNFIVCTVNWLQPSGIGGMPNAATDSALHQNCEEKRRKGGEWR